MLHPGKLPNRRRNHHPRSSPTLHATWNGIHQPVLYAASWKTSKQTKESPSQKLSDPSCHLEWNSSTRVICCILENFQTDEGITIPEALRPFMPPGMEFINPCYMLHPGKLPNRRRNHHPRSSPTLHATWNGIHQPVLYAASWKTSKQTKESPSQKLS